jgi:hypothetical protein
VAVVGEASSLELRCLARRSRTSSFVERRALGSLHGLSLGETARWAPVVGIAPSVMGPTTTTDAPPQRARQPARPWRAETSFGRAGARRALRRALSASYQAVSRSSLLLHTGAQVTSKASRGTWVLSGRRPRTGCGRGGATRRPEARATPDSILPHPHPSALGGPTLPQSAAAGRHSTREAQPRATGDTGAPAPSL